MSQASEPIPPQDSSSEGGGASPREQTEPTPGSTPVRFRWKPGVAILSLAIIVQAIFWVWRSPDRTLQVMSGYYIWPAVAFALFWWWLAFSGLPRRTRLIGVGSAAAVVGLFFLVFRPDGFTGDFMPRFAFRWSPSAEARAEAWWQSRPADRTAPFEPASPAGEEAEPPALEITEADWPQFRGPERNGIVPGVRLSRDWDENPPRLVWDQPVGLGWSSFAVAGRYAFTQEQRGPDETVVCYDLETGDQIWSHADRARFKSVMGGDGPRATPTLFDSRLYTLGGTGILNCLDPLSGRLLWSTNILEDAGVDNISWGMAASPLVYDDLVVVNPGGDAGQGRMGGLAAYDRFTGEKVWSDGGHPASYTAPRLATLGGLRQVLVFDGQGLGGHDAQTGRELWRSPRWTNTPRVNAALPIVLDDRRVLISSGYGTGSALLEVKEQGGTWTAEPAGWETSNHLKMKFNGGVKKDGHVYGLDEGILACLDLSTGRRSWKGGRYGYGQLVLIDDLLLILAESGEVILVEATPEAHREVTRFQAIEGKTWNHPVVVRDRLLVRNAQEAACYDLRPATPETAVISNTP